MTTLMDEFLIDLSVLLTQVSTKFPKSKIVSSTLLPRGDISSHTLTRINNQITGASSNLPNAHLVTHDNLFSKGPDTMHTPSTSKSSTWVKSGRGDPWQSYVRATSRQLFASPQLTTLWPLGKYNPYSNAVRNFPRSVREQELTRTPTTTTAAETDYKVTPIITTATTHPFSCYWAGIYLVQWTEVKIPKCMEIPKKLISFLKLIKSLI